MLLDVDSVLKSLNAIESVLFNIFSGVLATVTRWRDWKKVNQFILFSTAANSIRLNWELFREIYFTTTAKMHNFKEA